MKVDLSKVDKKYKVFWILLAVLGLIVNIILNTYIIDKFITIPLMIILAIGILFDSIAIWYVNNYSDRKDKVFALNSLGLR